MNRKIYKVNDCVVTVTETTPGHYCANVGTFTRSDYSTAPGEHKAVLLSFLDDAGREGAVSGETANWREELISEVASE